MTSQPVQTTTLPRPLHLVAEDLANAWHGVCVLTADFLRILREFDRREGYLEWGYIDSAQWLDVNCGISRTTAREKVRVAKRLGELPLVEKAFSEGRLSYSKVRALTRVAHSGNEEALVDMATTCPASELEARLREMENGGALSSPGGEPRAEHRLTVRERDGDRVVFKVELSREDAAVLVKALEVAKAELLECGCGGRDGDDPSLAADALMLMARRTLSGCFRGSAKEGDYWWDPDTSRMALDEPTPEQSGPAHMVTVHVSEAALDGRGGTSDLPSHSVRRLLCDGALVGVVEDADGAPLSVGRKTRTVPTKLRRALEARDRRCRYPGCNHARWLDAHHIHHWADGGETSLDNLVLLCTHHHRLLHEGAFQILERERGGYYFADKDGGPIGLEYGGAFTLGEEFTELRTWGSGAVDLSELIVSPSSPAATGQFPNDSASAEAVLV